MLNEDLPRAILPAQIAPLVQWGKLEGCVILCLGKKDGANHLVMSSVTVSELVLLNAQLTAHVNGLLSGSLVESLPHEGPSVKN
jgi:hypothetical protein